MKVKKAIIPAAGLGTRFLPATKSLPKEMLPIVDIPAIQLIVEEAARSGIEEILIITNSNKQAIENHFDINYELESRLRDANKQAEEKMIRDIAEMSNVLYIRQKEPKGLGHAISCAKAFVGNEPFAVLLGDDIVVNETKPALKQLIEAFDEKQASILGVQRVAKKDVSKYGIVKTIDSYSKNNKLYEIDNIVEKPNQTEAPSDLAVLGRYVLTAEIFEILEHQKPGKNNEIQLTDAIATLLNKEAVYAYEFSGKRYDIGDKFGYLKANIDFALNRDDIQVQLYEYLKEIIK
ncbi:UTP--glucose-1-phosphate uridylyltransferase GalU [Erysipelotrichaceae bacterium OttesenSCG-928-M19]|nr:UTP--glucose-1-phosphate uridylyltransferase GalU [Erysipelotrichaceae bacterium OttesenSCG-928-M19]